MEEEDRPRPPARFTPPASLDGWGVEELRAYVTALTAEIARAEAAIAARQGQRSAAEALFRQP
ncbi:MAG TPA: DUF1192 domain-containing protein [Crenalkalicoccus sp.]|nr:DUF1192 domain-containing protein [Crenalkalicoccus sp.]